MKNGKLLALTLALALVLGLAACGGGNPDTSGPVSTAPVSDAGPVAATELKPSMTPAKGWVLRDEGDGFPTYECEKDGIYGASFIIMVTEDFQGYAKTAEEYVQSEYDYMYDDSMKFSDISKTTVGGMDALKFAYSLGSMRFVCVYVCVGTYAYSIMYSARADDFELLAGDFTSMLDSYTLR